MATGTLESILLALLFLRHLQVRKPGDLSAGTVVHSEDPTEMCLLFIQFAIFLVALKETTVSPNLRVI